AIMLASGLVVGLAAAPSVGLRPGSAAADSLPSIGESLNIGLTGTAVASTEQSGSPASNAVDGSASTEWCSAEWTGTLTVDLGRVRSLDGFGLTLAPTATTALVQMQYAVTQGDWHPVPGVQQQSVPAGEPVYWPASDGRLSARYVQVSVTDNDGTPPCIGELRLFERVPPNTIPDRGADLSFEPH